MISNLAHWGNIIKHKVKKYCRKKTNACGLFNKHEVIPHSEHRGEALSCTRCHRWLHSVSRVHKTAVRLCSQKRPHSPGLRQSLSLTARTARTLSHSTVNLSGADKLRGHAAPRNCEPSWGSNGHRVRRPGNTSLCGPHWQTSSWSSAARATTTPRRPLTSTSPAKRTFQPHLRTLAAPHQRLFQILTHTAFRFITENFLSSCPENWLKESVGCLNVKLTGGRFEITRFTTFKDLN